MKARYPNNTLFFRIVTAVVCSLLILSSIANAFPKRDDLFRRFIAKLHSLFFDVRRSPDRMDNTRYYSVTAIDTCGARDPSCPPPPPPHGPQRGP